MILFRHFVAYFFDVIYKLTFHIYLIFLFQAEQSSQEEEDDEGELEADLDNSNPDTIVVSISQDFLDGVQAENKIDFTPKPPLKRKKEISQAKLTMADVYGDEFQMFADYIADQLKKMPIELALSLQHNIQNMIEEARYEFDIID